MDYAAWKLFLDAAEFGSLSTQPLRWPASTLIHPNKC